MTSRSLPEQSETSYNKQNTKYFRKILRNSLQNLFLFLSLIKKKVWTQKARFGYYKDLFRLLKVQSKRTKICITNSFLMHTLPTKHTSLFLYQFEKVVLSSFDVRAFALSYCVLFSCIWLLSFEGLLTFFPGGGRRRERGISEEREMGIVLGWLEGGETVVNMYCMRE